jgi:hypothetical protein
MRSTIAPKLNFTQIRMVTFGPMVSFNMVACILLFTSVLFSPRAAAELSPQVYQAMQANAPVMLVAKVLAIKSAGPLQVGSVDVEAQVLNVVRARGGKVKPGDIIRVAYVRRVPDKPMPGPAPMPLLVANASYQMYLEQQVPAVGGVAIGVADASTTYSTAARAASFVQLEAAKSTAADALKREKSYLPPSAAFLRECVAKFSALQAEYAATTNFAPPLGARSRTPAIQALGDMRRFPTMVKNAAQSGTRFGGQYAIDYFGCGTACTRSVIVDFVNRVAFAGPMDVDEPITTPTSRVIITRAIDVAAPDPSWEFGYALPAAYVVEKRGVRHLLTCPDGKRQTGVAKN